MSYKISKKGEELKVHTNTLRTLYNEHKKALPIKSWPYKSKSTKK